MKGSRRNKSHLEPRLAANEPEAVENNHDDRSLVGSGRVAGRCIALVPPAECNSLHVPQAGKNGRGRDKRIIPRAYLDCRFKHVLPLRRVLRTEGGYGQRGAWGKVRRNAYAQLTARATQHKASELLQHGAHPIQGRSPSP